MMGDPEFKRRLARAIAANQAQAFTRFQRKRSVVKQGHMAKGQVGIGERKNGHGGDCRCWGHPLRHGRADDLAGLVRPVGAGRIGGAAHIGDAQTQARGQRVARSRVLSQRIGLGWAWPSTTAQTLQPRKLLDSGIAIAMLRPLRPACPTHR